MVSPQMVVSTTEAAIQLANFLQSSSALYTAGHMTQAQLAQAWSAVGVKVEDAYKLWEQSLGNTDGATKSN